jgi:hypothetical protein
MGYTNSTPHNHCPVTCPASTRIEWLIQHYRQLRQNLALFQHERLSPIERNHNHKVLGLVDGFLDHLWEVYTFGLDCIETQQLEEVT